MPDAGQQLAEIVARANGHLVMPVPVALLAEHLAAQQSGRHHHLKTWQPYWDAIQAGTKTFDYRLNDRGFQNGDIVHLWEFIPTEHPHDRCDPSTNACGRFRRELVFRIGFLLAAGPRIPLERHVVFSLLPMGGA